MYLRSFVVIGEEYIIPIICWILLDAYKASFQIDAPRLGSAKLDDD